MGLNATTQLPLPAQTQTITLYYPHAPAVSVNQETPTSSSDCIVLPVSLGFQYLLTARCSLSQLYSTGKAPVIYNVGFIRYMYVKAEAPTVQFVC